jgi:hypothetical protein
MLSALRVAGVIWGSNVLVGEVRQEKVRCWSGRPSLSLWKLGELAPPG